MKVGILTYHRTLNYGACMQALATRFALEKLGHDVYYVDYWPKYHQNRYELFSVSRLMSLRWPNNIKYLIGSFKNRSLRKLRQEQFTVFFNEYIFPYCRPLSEEYDVVIYGSDQIWRKQPETGQYNPMYFGANSLKTKRHIAFSASMGFLPESQKDRQLVKNLVSHFDSISVREQDLMEELTNLGIHNVRMTIDPTLLLDKESWDQAFETAPYSGPRYVLVYSIGNSSEFNMNSIKEYAKNHGLMIKTMLGTASHSDTDSIIATAGPTEFIRMIRNADCIFTSSFHGLAFSLIYEKEVYASFSKNSNRAKTLLENAGIPERLLKPGIEIPPIPPINYERVNSKVLPMRISSFNYLINL